MNARLLLDKKQLDLTLTRLCHQLIENHNDFSNTAIIALQPRGVHFGKQLHQRLLTVSNAEEIPYGELDVTFYRDDFRRRAEPLQASATELNFVIEDKNIVLIDDVLFTGRSIRSGLDALLDFGRPKSVELMVLIDRRYSRHLPIQPDYIGKTVDVVENEVVKVKWFDTSGEVLLYNESTNDAT